MSSKEKVVTRMAPSPTGHLHIGTVWMTLFNFLYARKMGGTFILRIEDTDKARSKKEYEDEIIEGLTWLGLTWDALFRQSERTDIYRSYLEKAIADGHAYVSKEESKREPGTHVEVIRLKNPNTSTTFTDKVRGDITFDTTELGDFVIARSIDDALYHFTVVVDDHEMGITHVIRGEDHISNTPRQILIQEAIGASRPIYAHLPLILAPDRSKLSKRTGTVRLEEYKNEGFLRDAILNYLALLGWNEGTDREIYTLTELIDVFSLERVHKSSSIFDRKKFLWINKEHLMKLPDEEYKALLLSSLPGRIMKLPQYSDERLERLLPVIRERVHIMSEVVRDAGEEEYDFAFAAPKARPEMLMWKKDSSPTDALPRLEHTVELLSNSPEDVSPETAKGILWDYANEVGKGELLWPLRVALTGREHSPDPFTIIHIIGIKEAINRIKAACDTIKGA